MKLCGLEFVINESQRNQSIYIEQIDHGKLDKISSTPCYSTSVRSARR
jgi:hypothetical protein